MKTDRDHLISVFSRLGERLEGFGSDDGEREVIAAAVAENGWFTHEGIVSAVENIRLHMLDRTGLSKWASDYKPAHESKNVGVITAGNIPLVGFFDLMCVLISGHRLYYKASSKDEVMTEYILSMLLATDPAMPIYKLEEKTPLDAIIATGSDNTNRYFRSHYGSIPAVFRGSRSSVGVLSGGETKEQLTGLANDIFSYSGLGCRNVSHIIVPRGYDFKSLLHVLDTYENINPKYLNNYRQRAALLAIEGCAFVRGPFYVLREDDAFPAYISEVTWHTADEQQTKEWLAIHDSEIQCVAGMPEHPRGVVFGQTQSPSLYDYPDAVDTMNFLGRL